VREERPKGEEAVESQVTLPERISFVAEASGIREYRMANGMKILLCQQTAAPVVAFMVLYYVGSRNEAVGYTGATHLLEHMLFKGTPTFNARRGTQIAALLHRIGAAFNATTWFDRTNYFEAIPREHLEFVIRLEADRMRNSLIRDEDRESERIVVRNELERGENDPLSVLEIQTWATAFREHPYHHPTIGWRSDVENVPTERLREFYHTFYWPDNATAIVVGDFDPQETLRWLDTYFGVIPRSAHPRPAVYTVEPPQEGERRFLIRRAGEVGALMMGYHTPQAEHPDTYALAVLSRILAGGVATRFYQRLIDGELALSVRAHASHLRDPGLFEITAVLRPGIAHERVEHAIRDEIARLQDELVGEQELMRAKNKIEADTFYARDGALNFSFALGEAEAAASWRWFIDYVPNMRRVTAEDVQRVVRQYLYEDNLTVGWFVPKDSGRWVAGGRGPREDEAVDSLHRPSAYSPTEGSEMRGRFDPLPIARGAAVHRTQGEGRWDDPSRPFAERTERFVFPNGLTLLVLENRANPTVEVRGALRAGRYFEPVQKPGLAAAVASMLLRGTTHRTKLEIAQALEDVGAEVHLSANRFLCHLSGQFLRQDVGRVLEIIADVLRRPSFPDDELSKFKKHTIGRIRRSQENTGVRALERFSQLVFEPNNPFYEPSAEERIQSVEALRREDLVQFYQDHYGAASMVLVLVGDVVAAEVTALVEPLFGEWEPGVRRPIQVPRTPLRPGGIRDVLRMPDKASVDVVLGHAGQLRRTDPDYYAAIIANAALGYSTLSSRLGVRVRDQEGLSYGIISRFLEPTFADGPWVISVTVNPSNVERAIESTIDVVRSYVAEGMTPEELENETSAYIGSFTVGLGTNGGIANQLLMAELYGFGPDYLDRIPADVEAVGLEEANTAIEKYIHPDRLITVIAGEYDAS